MQDLKYSQEADQFHLTEEEAFAFIHNTLNLRDADQMLGEDRLGCLNTIIYAMHQSIPFQSIYRCSIPEKDRHRPTFSVIKNNMFKRYGGTCETIQPFFMSLLDAVGFKTDLYPASILGNVEGHMGIMVHDLSFNGSKHMVEVGCGHPVFTAIPLNFSGESPTYLNSFLRHKFLQRPDGILEWLHQSKTQEDEWFKFAELNTSKLVSVSYFLEKNEMDYTDPLNKFNRFVWASKMTGNRLFAVKGNTVTWTDEKGQNLAKKEIKTKEEMESLLHDEFPQFPIEMIQQSLCNTNAFSS